MTLSHQGFDRQLSAMLSGDTHWAGWLVLASGRSQGIQNSQQLTGGYFHDNGPSSPPLLCSLLKSVLQARPPKTFSDVDFVLMKLSKTLNFFLEKEVKTSNSLEKAF